MLKFMRDAEQPNFAVEIPQSKVVMIDQLHVKDGASGGSSDKGKIFESVGYDINQD
jgi:hypothetical protein